MKRIFTIIAVVVMALAGSGLMLAQGTADPFLGTWKLNVAKSTYTGATAPQSEMRTNEAQGNAVKVSVEGIAADGSRIAYTFTTDLDGKPVPVTGSGSPGGADMVAVKRINSNRHTATSTKAGQVVRTFRDVVSEDGKVLTVVGKATDVNGQIVSVVTVWDKQ